MIADVSDSFGRGKLTGPGDAAGAIDTAAMAAPLARPGASHQLHQHGLAALHASAATTCMSQPPCTRTLAEGHFRCQSTLATTGIVCSAP